MFLKLFLEGFLTTCSFDFLTDDEDTKVFVGAIFTWSYVIPMFLIVFFYSQLMTSFKKHEKMLKDQVTKIILYKYMLRLILCPRLMSTLTEAILVDVDINQWVWLML